MQAEALVTNPCFYKGFFSRTDNLLMKIYFVLFMKDQGSERTENYFSELIISNRSYDDSIEHLHFLNENG